MSPEEAMSQDLVTVFEAPEEAEALVVHGLLESAGIQSTLISEYGHQIVLAGIGGFRLRVLPERADDARRVIEEYRSSPGAEMEANGEPEAGP